MVVREIWINKHNFGGGHLGFQDGRHAKRIFLYSSPMGQNRHTSGCTYIFGVEDKYGSSHQLFCGGHFKIQDYRHIGVDDTIYQDDTCESCISDHDNQRSICQIRNLMNLAHTGETQFSFENVDVAGQFREK